MPYIYSGSALRLMQRLCQIEKIRNKPNKQHVTNQTLVIKLSHS